MAVPTDGEEPLEDMALCFAQELISTGWSEEAIMHLFQQPFYRAPNLVYQRKGAAFVENVIRRAKEEHQRCLERFGGSRNPERR
jgi:hypothetical protein